MFPGSQIIYGQKMKKINFSNTDSYFSPPYGQKTKNLGVPKLFFPKYKFLLLFFRDSLDFKHQNLRYIAKPKIRIWTVYVTENMVLLKTGVNIIGAYKSHRAIPTPGSTN